MRPRLRTNGLLPALRSSYRRRPWLASTASCEPHVSWPSSAVQAACGPSSTIGFHVPAADSLLTSDSFRGRARAAFLPSVPEFSLRRQPGLLLNLPSVSPLP